jgi:Antitoxin Xre/MbcA/ParS C-terminal toxin-binding domain/Anti-sigma factor NepR
MNAKSRAEAYEKLKDLRRQGDPETERLFTALGRFNAAELLELLYVAEEPGYFELMRGIRGLSEENRLILQNFLTTGSHQKITAATYEDIVREDVPDRFAILIQKLDMPADADDESRRSGSLFTFLEIKTLADRVFGDEDMADAWLNRPNSSLSGQKPADLLRDEVGAAVVRELLERIDHGIFA